MDPRHRRLHWPLCLLLLAPQTSPASGAPETNEAESSRFGELVRLLLLPDEQSLLKDLDGEKDRLEFQRIFWARRDPSPGTPQNELEEGVRAAWTRADELFTRPNQRGAETGCGQVLALLGPPELVEGLDAIARFDNLQAAREGPRRPEAWTYRNRPGRPDSFTRGELRLSFDPDCRFDEAGIAMQDLRRIAASRVVRPELAYSRGPDGHLVPLAAEPTTAAADFPLAAEAKILMRAAGGQAYVAGLLRAAAESPGPTLAVSVAAQPEEAASPPATTTREVALAPESGPERVVSWGIPLKPGRYTLTLTARLPASGKTSRCAIEVDVPDFSGGVLVASPLVLYPDEPAPAGSPDANDPYAAMRLGPMRLRPHFGNVFAPQDALMVVATLYGGKRDATSGLANLRARYSILKNGKPVARGAEDVFTTPDAVASVGPIPLASYAPGAYVVRLDVTDTVANQTLRQEAALEIRVSAAGGTP